MRPAIEARAIGQRTRSGAVTLRDISLTIGRGELVAIIGGSGSGKTTLLDAMSGLRPPSSGSVHRASASTGYVPAGETIHLELALDRALRYAAALRAVPEPDTVVDEVLPMLDLATPLPRSSPPQGPHAGRLTALPRSSLPQAVHPGRLTRSRVPQLSAWRPRGAARGPAAHSSPKNPS